MNAHLQAHQTGLSGVHRLPELRLSNMTNDGWADLHGPAVKAANTRTAAPCFKKLVMRYYKGETPLERSLRSVVSASDSFYKVLYSQPIYMSDEAVAELRAHCLSFGEHYMRLRELARRESRLVWRVTPKVHKLQHIPTLATYFNPDRISERELNLRFGHYPTSGTEKHASPRKIGAGGESIVMPRLLLYPDHNLNSSQVID